MRRWLLALLYFLIAHAALAQGIDDCPPNHVRHPALTGLDAAAMDAAITASFTGLFGRLPSRVPGSGADDVAYWIRTADHYGPYSDDICRAGWNLYRERQLGSLPTGPAEGDQPARFQPSAAPIPTPPLPSLDLSRVLSAIAALEAADRADQQALLAQLAALSAKVDNPGWFVKIAQNRYVQLTLVAVGTCAATQCWKAGK